MIYAEVWMYDLECRVFFLKKEGVLQIINTKNNEELFLTVSRLRYYEK